MKRKLSQTEIDHIVVAQANEDSAWEKPIRVRLEKEEEMPWDKSFLNDPYSQGLAKKMEAKNTQVQNAKHSNRSQTGKRFHGLLGRFERLTNWIQMRVNHRS